MRRRRIALLLSSALVTLTLPASAPAATFASAPSQGEVSTTLTFSGEVNLGNGWLQAYSVYVDRSSGDVWGDGYLYDMDSVDSAGSPTRWLSYVHENGEFEFLGSDGDQAFRALFGPEDVTWSLDDEGTWSATIAHADGGTELWPVVVLAVAVAVVLSGDSGCSCGHNGGTENHPGTNHPEE